MKKTAAIIIILSMILSVVTFIPTVYADEGSGLPADTILTAIEKINNAIFDNVNYYINIKEPKQFAVSGNNIAVVQENDVILKISDMSPLTLEGEAYYKDANGKSYPLNTIEIDENYLYLSYYLENARRVTNIHKLSTRIPDNIKEKHDFAWYLSDKNITGTDAQLKALTDSAEHIYNANNKLYVVTGTGSIFTIGSSQIEEISASPVELISKADHFAVSEDEEFFIYCSGSENNLLKKSKSSDSFERCNLRIDNIVSMKSIGKYLLILTTDALNVYSVNNFDKAIGSISLNKDPISFDVNVIGEDIQLSIAFKDSANIMTYSLVNKEGTVSFEFLNHYGANCTCDTPHKGWLNSPHDITANSSETTVYVVDNSHKRINIFNNGNQYFYDVAPLNLPTADLIRTDNNDLVYIASGNRLAVYNDNGKYSDEGSVPFSRVKDYSGIDGNIQDIFMTNNSSNDIYLVTDKRYVYRVDNNSSFASKILTLNHDAHNIYVSADSKKLYVAGENEVSCYDLKNTTNPVIKLTSANGSINDFIVDYNGNVYVMNSENKLILYKRTKEGYNPSQVWISPNGWNNVKNMYVSNTGNIYFVDSSIHIAEKLNNSEGIGFTTGSNYAPPTDYNKLYVGSATVNTYLFEAPDNYEIYTEVNKGDYLYILASDTKYTDMYYAINSNGKRGYIDKNVIREVPATKDSVIGDSFISLFNSTKVYQYPDLNAPQIDETSSTMTLIDNVGYENGKMVWQNDSLKWLHVRYTNKENLEMTGYVRMSDITVNISSNAPATKIYLRIKTAVGETATMYDLPDTASNILVKHIKNGSLVLLMDETFDESKPFTRVQYESDDGEVYVGYIETRYLQKNAFTTMQFIAIILTVITVLITVTVIILIVHYKRKKDNQRFDG